MKTNYPITEEQYKKLLKKADELEKEWGKGLSAQRQADFGTGLKRMLDIIFFADDKEVFGENK